MGDLVDLEIPLLVMLFYLFRGVSTGYAVVYPVLVLSLFVG